MKFPSALLLLSATVSVSLSSITVAASADIEDHLQAGGLRHNRKLQTSCAECKANCISQPGNTGQFCQSECSGACTINVLPECAACKQNCLSNSIPAGGSFCNSKCSPGPCNTDACPICKQNCDSSGGDGTFCQGECAYACNGQGCADCKRLCLDNLQSQGGAFCNAECAGVCGP